MFTENEQLVINAIRNNPDVSNREIAAQTYMAVPTVRTVLGRIYKKLELDGFGKFKREKLNEWVTQNGSENG